MFVAVRKGIDKICVARHPSVCGLLRIHRPLGSLANGCLPQRLPCKGSCLRQQTDGCSAWLHLYSDGLRHIRGGRERPPYKLTGNVCRAFYRQPAANLSGPLKIIGPYAKARATRKEPSNTRRQCTPPASLTRCHLPLQGRLSKQQPPAKPPLQGEVDAPSGADGGVRRLAAPLPLRVGRGCIAAPAGDDACIVPRGCGWMTVLRRLPVNLAL